MRRRIVFIALFIQILLASMAFAQSPQITNGLNYLNSTQNSDGSWLSGEEITLTTAEAIKTLRFLNQTNSANYTNAVSWLQNQSLESTNDVAQRIYILSSGGTDSGLLVSYLDRLVYAWGGYSGYSTDNLDTALAIQALKAINYADQYTIQSAINYLLMNQNADGGWGFYAGDVSNVYMTATIVTTFAQLNTTYSLQNQINKAASFLLSKQNTDGGFGVSTSTVYETALALEALVNGGVNISAAFQPAINYLTANQLTDGSWNSDAYSTSVALRAFANFKPDMVITTSDITFSKPNPTVGDTITVSADVKNAGPVAAQNVLVRFYNGDPNQGGVLIGEVTVPSIDAYGSAAANISWTIPSVFAGQVFVVVNPLNTVDELNRNNDTASRNITSATLPDLSISSPDISFNPVAPHSGDAVIVAANVRNIGETAAGNVSVDFYDGNPATGGKAIGGTVISAIGAGSSVMASISSLFTNGNHAVYVVVDQANTIIESSKINNTASRILSIGGGTIELAISRSDISFSPATPIEGDTVTINATIHNLGDGTAENVQVAFYLGDPDNGGTAIGSSASIPSLSGRGSANVSTTWNTTGHAGKNDIYIKVDQQDMITENNKLNNQAFQSLVILGKSGADLSISASDIQFTAAPAAGVPVVVSATVYNIGTQDAANVTVEISLGDPNVAGTLIFGTQTIPSIPKGGSATVQATLNTTGYAGDYEIYVNVDPFNAIVETNKANNLTHATIDIKASMGPDLIVTAIDTTGMTTDTQTLAISGNVKVTIRNNGNSGTTMPFDITAFEDTDKNKKFDLAIDKVFGKVIYSNNLVAGASDTVNIPVSGTVLFKDNLLYVMLDSGNAITELDETNNILSTGQQCASTPQVGTFHPVEKWKWTGSTTLPAYNQVMMTPVVARIADTNGDGVIDDKDVPIVIFSTFAGGNYVSDGVLRAVRGDNGQEIFTVTNPSYRVAPGSPIAVADIDNDGFLEIIARKSGGGLIAFKHDGTLKWMNSTTVPSMGGISIADINNDGKPKIIIGATAFNSDGVLLWKGTGGTGGISSGAPISLVADVNLDGVPEIIGGNTIYDKNGTILCSNSSVPDGYNAVARFDANDPYPQIVVVSNGNVYLLDHNCQKKWGPVAIPGGGVGGPPLIADFDSDGKPEIGVAGAYRYVAIRYDGTIMWQSVTSDYSSSQTGSSVFDFQGDGKAKVIYNDEHYLRIYNGSDGRKLFEIANSSGTAWEYPVIADIDNDGHAEVVVAANNYAWGADKGIRVFGDANNSWVNTRQIWNQHAYHITNVNDDGTIPRVEQNNWDKYNNYRCNVLTKNNPLNTPDAIASYFTADMTSFPASVNLSTRIGNGGAIVLPTGVDVDFYDGDPASGGIFIGTTKTSKDINPGEYEDVSITWNSPAAGVHNVFVVVDGTNKITECRKDNNTANASLTVGSNAPPVVKLPDLTLSPVDIVITPPSLTDGQTAIINATIHNIGNLGAANINVSFYDGDPQNGGTLIGSKTIQSIDAGATALTSVSWNSYGQSGRNYIHVVIDPQNLIVEFNKNNNSSLVALDVATPTKPDLAITFSDITFSNTNPKAGAVVLVNVAVHNLGTAVSNVEVYLYDGDPASGGTLITQKVIQQIIPAGGVVTLSFNINTLGLSGTKNYFISLDPNNKIDEISKANNIASAAINVMSSNVSMSISTDKATYAASENVSITVIIFNQSSSSRTGTLDVQMVDANGISVATVASGQQINLGPNENKTLTFTWNAGTSYTGGYKAVALLSETDTVIARAEAAFVISNNASVSSRVATDKMSYKSNEPVAITSTVQSTTTNIILNNLTANIKLTGSGGTVLFTDTKTIPILTPGQLTQLNSYWNTAVNAQGNYTVRLDILGGTNLLSTAMAGFAISGSANTGSGLTGSLTATPNPVYKGKDENITYVVTNNGNEDLSNVNIEVLVVDPDTQQTKQVTQTTNIPKGASVIGSATFNTATLIPKVYMVVLRASSSTVVQPKTLGSTNFEVKKTLEASTSIPDVINLLVWVDKKCIKTKDRQLIGINCVPDPGKDKDCMRVDLLENILKDSVSSYQIVYDKKDFQNKLRNPFFTDIIILGDQNPMEDHYNEELRELVYSGKGLISSVFLKQGEDNTPLFGIKFKGYLPDDERNIDLLDSPISVQSSLNSIGKAAKVEALTGTTVAGWMKTGAKGTQGNDPAIVLNTYGQGKTVYYAFDLGATLNDTNYAQIASLIKNSITNVHKQINTTAAFQPKQFIPVQITLKGSPVAIDLILKDTYPAQLKIYDPATNKWITDNPWIRNVHIEANETKNVFYYLLTPDSAGSFSLLTEVGYTEGETFKPYQSFNTNIVVSKNSEALTNDIISALRLLPVNSKDWQEVNEAIKRIMNVKSRNSGSSHDCQANIGDILEAIEELMEVKSCDTTSVRLMMDNLLRIYEGQFYYG